MKTLQVLFIKILVYFYVKYPVTYLGFWMQISHSRYILLVPQMNEV